LLSVVVPVRAQATHASSVLAQGASATVLRTARLVALAADLDGARFSHAGSAWQIKKTGAR
jgi:hypothetical protein